MSNGLFFCNGSNLKNFNGSVFRICGAGAGAGALKTFCLEPESEPEPKCFPGAGVGAGAVKNFHGSASLVSRIHPLQRTGLGGRVIPLPVPMGEKNISLSKP